MTEPSREDRLNLIVALAVKNKTHPNKNNFVSFVRRIYASKFNLSVAQTRAELDILVKAYQAERHEDPEEYHAPKPDGERIIW